MPLFHHENRDRNDRTRALYALYEIAHTAVDFTAAMLFLVGSVLFFWKAYETPAIWCFVLGSVFFATKPTLRLAREIHLYRAGRLEPLVQRETR
ncbi:YrhK family protein [Roseivivax sp. CAU 1753]